MQHEKFCNWTMFTRKLKGNPVTTRAITDGWASAARDTLLAGTRDKGEKWIPCCAGVIAALASILLFIPVAGPGANHATPFPFSSNHPSLLPTNQHMTAGRKWCKKQKPCPVWPASEPEWPLFLAKAHSSFLKNAFKFPLHQSTPVPTSSSNSNTKEKRDKHLVI